MRLRDLAKADFGDSAEPHPEPFVEQRLWGVYELDRRRQTLVAEISDYLLKQPWSFPEDGVYVDPQGNTYILEGDKLSVRAVSASEVEKPLQFTLREFLASRVPKGDPAYGVEDADGLKVALDGLWGMSYAGEENLTREARLILDTSLEAFVRVYEKLVGVVYVPPGEDFGGFTWDIGEENEEEV